MKRIVLMVIFGVVVTAIAIAQETEVTTEETEVTEVIYQIPVDGKYMSDVDYTSISFDRGETWEYVSTIVFLDVNGRSIEIWYDTNHDGIRQKSEVHNGVARYRNDETGAWTNIKNQDGYYVFWWDKLNQYYMIAYVMGDEEVWREGLIRIK